MGSLFRSEEMSLVQLIIPADAAFETVADLGDIGIAQFRDLNLGVSQFQRHQVSNLRRCEVVERKLDFFEALYAKNALPAPIIDEVNFDELSGKQPLEAPASREEKELAKLQKRQADLLARHPQLATRMSFLSSSSSASASSGGRQSVDHMLASSVSNGSSPGPSSTTNLGLQQHLRVQELEELEVLVAEHEKDLRDLSDNEARLQNTKLDLVTRLQVHVHLNEFLNTVREDLEAHGVHDEDTTLLDVHDVEAQVPAATAERGGVRFSFVAGTIDSSRLTAFEKILWRVSRGNAFVRTVPLIPQTNVFTLQDGAGGSTSGGASSSLQDVFGDRQIHMFCVFFQGTQLETRINRIALSFDATIVQCSDLPAVRNAVVTDTQRSLEELDGVLRQLRSQRQKLLVLVSDSHVHWLFRLLKIKATYTIMNHLQHESKGARYMIAEVWVPTDELGILRASVIVSTQRASAAALTIVTPLPLTGKKPPTFNRVNKFTAGFQNIVDAFGIANYREVNPAPFTVITFPFLFAVMFGDFGHGLIMFLAALYLVRNEVQLVKFKREGGEIFSTLFGGRYIVLLMGLFSIYTGLIYNDIFGKGVDIFTTGWDIPSVTEVNGTMFAGTWNGTYYDGINASMPDSLDFDPTWMQHPYVIGIDPVWHVAENRLTFLNPYKMKISVILGILHMEFGIALSVFNHVHFGNYLSIWAEFIPQVLFLTCIFGYLVFMIIFKWLTYWPGSQAPSLLITLINMFLKFGSIEKDDVLYLTADAQAQVQSALVIVALMCVPWMLLAKPIVLYGRHNKETLGHSLPVRLERLRIAIANLFLRIRCALTGKAFVPVLYNAARHASLVNNRSSHDSSSNSSDTPPGGASPVPERSHADKHHEPAVEHVRAFDEEEPESHEMGEIMVHQCIHTIEFCLGCISNTASYLRLWALSLAHAQLSEVLWHMIMASGLKGNIALLFFAWGAWAVLTICVLLIMEGLSAFLHALRLHWVEFQNKFYGGSGYKFAPFSFRTALLQAEE
ncbi:vacuolar proton ATPase [Capsaspora owczarzaki ATCC 30864]|uniref:Vacuolar proton ATPase n=1 Tax=Capsaspora owczarzaki (strain ATCC 30864) TaxID=595528 RepID=A0A0D2VK78_CAPO3|nr:vacuolar proton ATPase [Capsaspora owczarzaki ATCC 30864]KJE90422.1 vacuolar proton ATPase [Capsaspora owczarzaki ATCC 30864]|eukprot:XP_004364605.1 vacuolar proton ATPase [Capsaspora owczarzaki ATCC 30864]